MKRYILIPLMVLMLMLSSCVSTAGPIPYGKWECSEINLIMDINSDLEEYGFFPGVIVKDGNENKLLVTFSGFSKELFFFNPSDFDPTVPVLRGGNEVFSGDYKLKNGKLYYILHPRWQEETGYKVLVFEKVENYSITETINQP